ncbi:pirin family protein [Micrococcus terreus]|uniref:pirin family protein n=1 Tax=Micrococcus terreus TaxID=574650 RepID=UPI0021A309BE|nr:pirin family protein [Micrococcus terreus]MCT2089826.1 pirin family protein [Micrococcus terreus]
MSNTEKDPQETVCKNGPGAAPPAEPEGEQLRPARFTDGLSSGVQEHSAASTDEDAAHTVEVLEPRAVPLGGPRAMTVQRSLPQRARSLIGAWCFLDFYGPDDVSATGGMAVPRHPHTGLATVSWLFEGRIDHIDSAGNWATVRPGEVNLMNAGTGITHSEYSSQDTTVLHGAQLWYAFPDHARFSAPSLDAHRPDPITGEGYTAKVFLGSLLGQTSPVHTHLPLTGAEFRLRPGSTVQIEVPADHEHGVLAVNGPVHLDGVEVGQAHLGYVGTGAQTLTLTADPSEDPDAEDVIVLLIGGEPLGEQIIMWWNFVGRSHEEIATWRAAYQQEMGFEPADDATPLRSALPDDGTSAGAPVTGERLEGLVGTEYVDGRSFPQFGDFPPDQPAPIPAPTLPNTRMRPRG